MNDQPFGLGMQNFQGADADAFATWLRPEHGPVWQQPQVWQQPPELLQQHQQHDQPGELLLGVGTQQSQMHGHMPGNFYAGTALQSQVHTSFGARTTSQSQMQCFGLGTTQQFQQGLGDDGATHEYRIPCLSQVQCFGAGNMQQMQHGGAGITQQPQLQDFGAGIHQQQQQPETEAFVVGQMQEAEEQPSIRRVPAQKRQQVSQGDVQSLAKSRQSARGTSGSVHQQQMPNGPVLASGKQDKNDTEPSQAPGALEVIGSDGRKVVKLVAFDAPNYCKLLVPNHIAGALIGKEGTMVGEIELLSKCKMQISGPKAYFPGTLDRICLIGGSSLDGLLIAVGRVVELLRDITHNVHKFMMVKIVVPMSSASVIIGKRGEAIQRLTAETGCRINMSPRVESFQERLVIVSGETGALNQTVCRIVEMVQDDAHLKEHMHITYTQELPLGIWSGESTEPADKKVLLIHPDKAKDYTKRELIEYLNKAAPKEIIVRLGLTSSIRNAVKSKGVGELHDAVAEVWQVRGGDKLEAHEVDGPAGSSKGCKEDHRDKGQAMLRPVGRQGPVQVGLLPTSQPAAPASSSADDSPALAAGTSIPVAPTSNSVAPAASASDASNAAAPAATGIVASNASAPEPVATVASKAAAAAASASIAPNAVAPAAAASVTSKAVAPPAVAIVAPKAAAAAVTADVVSKAAAPAAAASVASEAVIPSAAVGVVSKAMAPAAVAGTMSSDRRASVSESMLEAAIDPVSDATASSPAVAQTEVEKTETYSNIEDQGGYVSNKTDASNDTSHAESSEVAAPESESSYSPGMLAAPASIQAPTGSVPPAKIQGPTGSVHPTNVAAKPTSTVSEASADSVPKALAARNTAQQAGVVSPGLPSEPVAAKSALSSKSPPIVAPTQPFKSAATIAATPPKAVSAASAAAAPLPSGSASACTEGHAKATQPVTKPTIVIAPKPPGQQPPAAASTAMPSGSRPCGAASTGLSAASTTSCSQWKVGLTSISNSSVVRDLQPLTPGMVQVGAGNSSAASQISPLSDVIDGGDEKHSFVSSVLSMDWFFQDKEEDVAIEGTEPLPEEPRLPALGARAKRSGLSRQDRVNLGALDAENGFRAPIPPEPADQRCPLPNSSRPGPAMMGTASREQRDNSRGRELAFTTLNVDGCVVLDTLLETRRFVGTLLDAVAEASTAKLKSTICTLFTTHSENVTTAGEIDVQLDATPADSAAQRSFRRCVELWTPAS